MPNEHSSSKRKYRPRVSSISATEATTIINNIKAAIETHNALVSAKLSDDEFVEKIDKLLQLVMPSTIRIVAPYVGHIIGREMARVATGNDRPSSEEIMNTLLEPETHRVFYPEIMRAGARAMIRITEQLWPSNVGDILYGSLSDLDAGTVSKVLTPTVRESWKGSLPHRKQLASYIALEVEFQKSANPNWSVERAVRVVTGQTRAGYKPDHLPPLIPLPSVSWGTIVNPKRGGLLALARRYFPQQLAEAAAAGRMIASGQKELFQRTEFARFRRRYLRFTPEALKALWARATGKDAKFAKKRIRPSKPRKA